MRKWVPPNDAAEGTYVGTYTTGPSEKKSQTTDAFSQMWTLGSVVVWPCVSIDWYGRHHVPKDKTKNKNRKKVVIINGKLSSPKRPQLGPFPRYSAVSVLR